jgi:putative DNA methylase
VTTPYRRKLIEVALPLEAINRESAREKSIRHGHPSTLHLWWARRPLAACRAVLFAQLVDDPSSRPEEFPTEEAQAAERKRLFDLIQRLVVWEKTTDERLLAEAHAEILKSCDGRPPAILDPFAGGGSIPLEAQRLGLEAHASDLNPVAVLINKALIEIPPKWAGKPPVFPGAADSKLGEWPGATGLAEDVRRYGQWMRDEAERRIGHLYPKATLDDGKPAPVIAWIWARTVTCPNPACGVAMPLVRSWWLGKKKGKEAYVVPVVGGLRIEFTIGNDPKLGPTKTDDGTISRTGARCVACGSAVPLARIRAEGKAGRLGAQLMAIVAEGKGRRIYLAPTPEHEKAADVPLPDEIPDTEIPHNPRYLTTTNYGMDHHADLFSPRQLTALTTFSDLVKEARDHVLADVIATGLPDDGVSLEVGGTAAPAYADSVAVLLAFVVSRQADYLSSLCPWAADVKNEGVMHVFGRQAISMIWDFGEAAPLGQSSGSWYLLLRGVTRVVEALTGRHGAHVLQRDAADLALPRNTVVATDPPYYDNVGYADLADFFYVWLRRSLRDHFPDLLGTVLTPKAHELVADPHRHGGNEPAERFFEAGFVDVFRRVRQGTAGDFPVTVFYAFKQAETDKRGTASTGWEVLLEGMIRSGWEVTATWPVRTERQGRLRDNDSNALASSVVLSLRPRAGDADAVNRRSFLGALKAELPLALLELQQGSIAPVDLAQAAIGPGMRVFSRYSRVVEADGADMTVRTALALVNQVLDEVLAEQEGDFDSDTRFCLKWFQQYAFDEGDSGEADVLSRATNTSVRGLERGGVFRAVAGRARLLGTGDLDSGWDPERDARISVWEVVVRLAKALDEAGPEEASRLMQAAGGRMDLDTAKELAYLLYSICERKGWAQTALLFNGLGTSWNDLAAASRRVTSSATGQASLDFADGE